MSPKSSVSNILELLLTGLTSNPHLKTKCTAVSTMSSFCSHLPNIYYTKRINPKSATEGACNHIYVSFRMRMLLSDIWSRSNFWVTVHPFWVLISVKQLIHSPIYRLNHFCCKCWLHSLDLFEWFWWYLWPKMALEMSQEFLTITLNITNKASPRLSLVEKFAKIAVYK